MGSLSDGAIFLLLIIAVPVAFGLFILPLALFLKKHGQALHDAGVPEQTEAGEFSPWATPKSRAHAQRACQQTAWLPFLLSALLGLQVLLGANPASLADAAILLICGIGLRRCSRSAALLAFVIYLAIAVMSFQALGFFNPLSLLYIAALGYGVYLSFLFHRLPPESGQTVTAA